MPSLRLISVLLSAGILSSCAVGPEYKKADAPLPDHYLGQVALDKRKAASNANFAKWWEGFGDPQLTQFVLLALEQNLDIAQAQARIKQAQSGLGAAHAALLPSGNVSAQAIRNHQSLESPLGQLLNAVPGYDRNANLYEANFNASWELDIFGGLRREHDAALAEYQAAKAGAIATRLAVAAQTADLYITVRGLQSRLEIAKKQLETQQQLVSKINILFSRGLAPKLQVQQAEAAVAQVEATIPVLEAGLDVAMNALDVILGAAPGKYRAELNVVKPIPTAPQIASVGSPADLLQRRPDLIVAERRLAIANAKIGQAISEYYPKVALSLLIGSATAISGGNMFSSAANQAAGVVGLRWRLFDFARIDAQIDNAKGQEAETLAAYRQSTLRAAEDVENAISALVKREQQTASLSRGEESMSQARESSFIAYQRGVVSLIEVLHVDENLLRISDAKAQAQAESARSAVAAFKALGGGWQPSELKTSATNQLLMMATAEKIA
jgi:NodT family efflux transporter outer membrane factor (OMF) lipoprotein